MSRERLFADKKDIINAAIELLSDKGYESFSTRSLAARLGVSPMTLYNYFSNREEIIQAAIEAAYEKIFEEFYNDLSSFFEKDSFCPLLGFIEMGKKLLLFSREQPKIYALVFIMNIMPYHEQPSVQRLFSITLSKVKDRLTAEEIGQDLQNHIYLFMLLVLSLVQNVYNGNDSHDINAFEGNIQIAYDRLLKPFEKFFSSSDSTIR